MRQYGDLAVSLLNPLCSFSSLQPTFLTTALLETRLNVLVVEAKYGVAMRIPGLETLAE